MLQAYLDANATIYFVERVEPYFTRLKTLMLNPQGRPRVNCCINELLLMEVRVKPLREDDQVLLARFEHYFQIFASQTIALDAEVFGLATQIRVKHGTKTPDALHLAAAIHAGCDQFWTHDDKLAKAAQGRIEVINIREPHGTHT